MQLINGSKVTDDFTATTFLMKLAVPVQKKHAFGDVNDFL